LLAFWDPGSTPGASAKTYTDLHLALERVAIAASGDDVRNQFIPDIETWAQIHARKMANDVLQIPVASGLNVVECKREIEGESFRIIQRLSEEFFNFAGEHAFATWSLPGRGFIRQGRHSRTLDLSSTLQAKDALVSEFSAPDNNRHFTAAEQQYVFETAS
jgi:hypothetical protein